MNAFVPEAMITGQDKTILESHLTVLVIYKSLPAVGNLIYYLKARLFNDSYFHGMKFSHQIHFSYLLKPGKISWTDPTGIQIPELWTVNRTFHDHNYLTIRTVSDLSKI